MSCWNQKPPTPRTKRPKPRYPQQLALVLGVGVAVAACGGMAPSFADDPLYQPAEEPRPLPYALQDPTAAPTADPEPGGLPADAGRPENAAVSPATAGSGEQGGAPPALRAVPP